MHLLACSVLMVWNIHPVLQQDLAIAMGSNIPKNWEPGTDTNAEILEALQLLTFFSYAQIHLQAVSNVNPDSWANNRRYPFYLFHLLKYCLPGRC